MTDFIHNHPEFFKKKSNRKKILGQLLSVTEYLHSHQVLHLDLKPSNIMITRIGHDLKLIDLGFSYTDSFPDTTGHTIPYAAPEQLEENETTDERTDIFAIGKIMEAIPFAGSMKRVAERCTRKEPEKRYQNIGEIKDALKRRTVVHWAAVAICLLVVSAIFFINSYYSSDKNNDIVGDSIMQTSTIQNVEEMESDETYQAVEGTDSIKPATEEIFQETVYVTPVITEVVPPPSTPSSVEKENPATAVVVANPEKPQKTNETHETTSKKTHASVKSVEQIIQEFKADIHPYVKTMIDYHIENGGYFQLGGTGKRYISVDDQYIKLRNEYTNKYYKSIENKLMNKYGGSLLDIDRYALPEKFEIAISEEEISYANQALAILDASLQ